ncbi:ABC transporter permease [Conexibacter sp. DBS9H8]|uniref:ABC transporter permease n=1 Tax=Conexibacter sp. DBS9H8 TaxID=2937801 RepID=UPI00201025A2|nr:ABC transporter permease [Conexibacter sp. DBS9H8]
MNWAQTLRVAVESLADRRARSALTVLGILIGIVAVILTVGLGQGAQGTISSELSSLGTNLLIITPGAAGAGQQAGAPGIVSPLTLADANALANHLDVPSVSVAAPVAQTNATLVAGINSMTAPLIGTTPGWLTARNRTTAAGQGLTQAQLSSDAHDIVIGSQVAQTLFPGTAAVGQTITIVGVPFTVTGVLNTAGSTASANQDALGLIPITTDQALFGATGPRTGGLNEILLSARSSQAMSAAYQEANTLLDQLHHITNPSQADFTIIPQTSLLSAKTQITRTLTILLAGIAAIALLVGGIGVMNIMLVSVTERIREIGLRKALGATPGTIRRQFLIEAVLLGLAGGLAGITIGISAAVVLTRLISQPITISTPAIIGSLIVAAGVGLVFGVYPASQAAKLAPIDALRSE